GHVTGVQTCALPISAGHHQLANEANRLLSGEIGPLGEAANISTRGMVGTGEDVLIGGFIITGSDSKKVLVRAIGPSLASFGISRSEERRVGKEWRDG